MAASTQGASLPDDQHSISTQIREQDQSPDTWMKVRPIQKQIE
jgi:hypothetical protein